MVNTIGGFNSESSAMISGKWINRQTGNVINVRDSIIDGDNMIIITDQGQIDLPTFSNNYIQASDDIYDLNGNKIGNEALNTNEIVSASKPINMKPKNELVEYDLIDDIKKNNDDDIIEKKNNTKNTTQNDENKIVENPKNNDEIIYATIIEKVFSKINHGPQIHIDIDWNNMPNEQINTLINYLDVPVEYIATYIIQRYVNHDELKNEIIQHLSDKST